MSVTTVKVPVWGEGRPSAVPRFRQRSHRRGSPEPPLYGWTAVGGRSGAQIPTIGRDGCGGNPRASGDARRSGMPDLDSLVRIYTIKEEGGVCTPLLQVMVEILLRCPAGPGGARKVGNRENAIGASRSGITVRGG